ncbi:MAG: N-6 DNA methylase [Desulfobacterales bacterium]|nr:N-6 DNA methylase [Desulfobacterales bacterium]
MKNFFKNIDFTFGTKNSDIKPSRIVISEDNDLTQKLKGNVYVFDSPGHTNTSFYVITIPLSEKNLFELRRYIWNEDKYDLYFLAENPKKDILTTLYYAKTNPRETEIKIKSFKGNEKDAEELETIKKWKFNSGAFWMSYAHFLDTIKKKQRIDKKLIEQLKQLKTKLQNELKQKVENPTEIVQALIDRTLFIKFLEDNHIINSFFYNYHFPNKFKADDADYCYKTLLKEHDIENINKLFYEINKIFNNILFKRPFIKKEYLTHNRVLNLIYEAIRQEDWKTGQMSLFDFRFNVIPTEFISHIYEVFLEDSQLDEGIYYTPDKLAHLIVDDTITGSGTTLDPACGSGMFLILAFRKLLEHNPPGSTDIYGKIEHKNKMLKDCIYGIEKNNTAWRLAVFSLYLEILKGLPAKEIKQFIRQKLKNNSDLMIFPYDFSDNIINHNALEMEQYKIPHNNKTFDYIVGNPPYVQIKKDDEEISFINDYFAEVNGKMMKASEVVGYNQLSQAFMLKIKDWAKPETRFGFVLNSSNFYNEKSKAFQKFFFDYYQTEDFYELSRVKKILFRKAKESVVVVIFNNKIIKNNMVSYYLVDMGVFSEDFDLLIIQEDKKKEISQKDILNEKIILRDYLIGNEYDLKLLDKLSGNKKLEAFLLKDKNYNSFRGIERIENKVIKKHYNIQEDIFQKLTRKEKSELHDKFASEKYLSPELDDYHNTPFVYNPEKILIYQVKIEGYINFDDITDQNFRRPKNIELYKGTKILFPRHGDRIRASLITDNLVFSTLIYGVKLQNANNYHLFTALLNSDLVNYYLSLKYRKRPGSNFSKLDTDAIKNIPIPKNLDEDLVAEISEMSQKLTKGKLKYKGKTKEKLNDLIFDLYELDILEITRIKEFFSNNKEISNSDLGEYKTALGETLEFYFKDKPVIEYYHSENLPFGLLVTAIYFNKTNYKRPPPKKKLQYIINKILKTTDEKFLAMREKVYGNDCIYIIKNNHFQSWTTTKAFEDGQEILKRFVR